MRINKPVTLLIPFIALLLQGCSKDADDTKVPPPGNTEGVLRIEDILQGNDQEMIALLNRVRGSVGKRGVGSKTVWSRKNEYGLGLYVSANHVYGLDTWQNRDEKFIDIQHIENGGIFETSRLPPVSGDWKIGDTLIADFPLYHPKISEGATNTTILPAEDFFLGIIDNQRVAQALVAQTPGPLQTGQPLDMYDPEKRTTAGQTWAVPEPGEKAVMVGYPRDQASYPNGAVAYGSVLSNAEALVKIDELKAAGDSEGSIPYNGDAEFFIEGKAIGGMSGGGVFNNQGRLLGIMVRASDKEGAPQIVRAVKMSHIRQTLASYYNSLPQPEKDKLRPFINGEL